MTEDELAGLYATGIAAAKAKVAARLGEAEAERWARRSIGAARVYAANSAKYAPARKAATCGP